MEQQSLALILLICASLIWTSYSAAAIGGFELSYRDLIDLKNCTSLDTCSRESSRTRHLADLRQRNCACDDQCTLFGDCCIDAQSIGLMAKLEQQWECVQMKQFGGIYMKSICPPDTGVDVHLRAQCERHSSTDRDPMSSMPVTNRQTRITYKNVYCAMCNQAHRELVFWTPRIECPSLKRYNATNNGNLTRAHVRQHMHYFEENGRWGVTGLDYPYMCDIDPVFPEIVQSSLRFCKHGFTRDCAPDWPRGDGRLMDACGAYQAVVYEIGAGRFWNPHCAQCNWVNVSRLTCGPTEARFHVPYESMDGRSGGSFNPNAFAMLLDINSGANGNDRVGSKQIVCEAENTIYDPFTRRCRNLLCGFTSYKLVGGQCLPAASADASGVDDWTTGEADDDLEADFLACPKLLVNAGDFLFLKNESIFVNDYNMVLNRPKYKRDGDRVLICAPFNGSSTFVRKFSTELGLVTLVGLGTSMFFILLHLIVFALVREVRNLSGKNMASLAIALLIAYSCFILSQTEMVKSVRLYCLIAGVTMHYFFILSFMWMNVMSYDVWRTLRLATTELRVLSGKQQLRFLMYTLYTSIVSGVIVASAAIFDQFPGMIPLDYQPGIGMNGNCWFNRRKSLLAFFGAPLAAIMLINLVLFGLVAGIIVRTNSGAVSKTSTQANSRQNFKLYLRLALIMGLSWVVGFLATYFDIVYLWYLFVVLNTLQGVFIFFAFSCNKKVQKALRGKCTSLTSGYGSSSQTSGLTLSTKPYHSNSMSSSPGTHNTSPMAASKSDGGPPWFKRDIAGPSSHEFYHH